MTSILKKIDSLARIGCVMISVAPVKTIRVRRISRTAYYYLGEKAHIDSQEYFGRPRPRIKLEHTTRVTFWSHIDSFMIPRSARCAKATEGFPGPRDKLTLTDFCSVGDLAAKMINVRILRGADRPVEARTVGRDKSLLSHKKGFMLLKSLGTERA